MVEPGMQAQDVIDKLTNQHNQILQLVSEFTSILDQVQTMSYAVKARGFLDNLGSQLDIHLKVEDKILYPILKKSPHQEIQKTAKDFSDEMGRIAVDFTLYLDKWTTSISIAADSKDFIAETKALIQLLAHRIDREDNELFPMLTSTF